LASWSRVTPGCTRASLASGSTSRIDRMWREVSTMTAALVVWPASAVPAPRNVTGVPRRWQARSAATMSSASRGHTTPSGGWR
jgi:hypothetical protein